MLDYITTSNVYWGKFELTDVKQMAFGESEREKCTAKYGDLLVCEGGDIGRAAIWNYDYPICIQNHLHRLRSYIPLCTKYFLYSLMYSKITGNIKGKGIGLMSLSSNDLHNITVALPPLAEQYRIVNAVDRLFSLIETIECSRNELYNTIAQLQKTILSCAIHGRLVPQNPEDEPASELLKRINPKTEITCDNAHYPQLPYGWASLRVGDICQLKNGYAFKSGLYANHGVRIIRIANVQDGYIEDNSPQYYTPEAMKGLEGFLLSEGDLLMSLTGNVGRVGFITNAFLPAALNQRVACIRNNNLPINIEYLYYFFQSEEFMSDCKKSGKGVAQQNISTEWLKDYTLPIPPLHEQERIVAAIKGMYSYLDTIKESL